MSSVPQSARGQVHKECALLCQALQSNRRTRVYRHHGFFRAAVRAARIVNRLGAAQSDMGKGKLVILKEWHLAHSALVHAVEAATQELAAQRIDTVSLCLVIIAVGSRMGCLVGQMLIRLAGRERCVRWWGHTHVEQVDALRATATGDDANNHNADGSPSMSRQARTSKRARKVRRTHKQMNTLGELLDSTLS